MAFQKSQFVSLSKRGIKGEEAKKLILGKPIFNNISRNKLLLVFVY